MLHYRSQKIFCNIPVTMAAQRTPKTPRRVMCVSPTRGPVEMRDELTFAPRKKQNVSLTKFLHEDVDFVKRDFVMSGNRVGQYAFDKVARVVKLYTVDVGDDFTWQDPCLIFPAKDWFMFFNYIWRDLNDCSDDPLYIAEWDGVTPNTRFRVVGDHGKKLPEDCVYIFCCNDKTKLHERTWPIPESEHHMHYDMRFLFQWKDVRMLDNIFTCIDKMFRWCDMYDRYSSVKVKLFHPERGVTNAEDRLLSPPTYYSH